MNVASVVFGIMLCWGALADASTYYVSNDSGNNANDGLSWDTAWKTIAYAGQVVEAGDTVIVRKSVNPYLTATLVHSGTPTAPITFRGEIPSDPPVVTGGLRETGWVPSGDVGIWKMTTGAQPLVVMEDGIPLPPATSPDCIDGNWFWLASELRYKPTTMDPANHEVWRSSIGGGIQLGAQSWVVIQDFACWLGQGACIGIDSGTHNVIRGIHSQWYARGIQIRGGTNNVIEGGVFEFNREGVYLLTGASYNTVRGAKVIHNGNAPTWTKGDRAGIAVGENGVNVGNRLIGNEVAFNGGKNSDVGLIVYEAPWSLVQSNDVHDNFSGGIMVAAFSDNVTVIANRVIHNGKDAVLSEIGSVSGLSIRRSKNALVQGNQVLNNYVSLSPANVYADQISGGIDLKGNVGDDMTGIQFIDNISCGTKNGPDIYLSTLPNR